MTYIQTIIAAIAKRFGLQLQSIPPDTGKPWSDTEGINLKAIVSEKVNTLTFQDSKIRIIGDSARANWLREFLENYADERIPVAGNVALGTGDGILKPYTDGKRYGLDIIGGDNGDFRVCESIGNDILACVLKTGEIKDEKGNVFQRFEVHMVRDAVTESGQETSALIIHNLFYKSEREIREGDPSFPAAWRGIPESIVIPNYDKPLFGRIKCPTVNRKDVNGVNGVDIASGAEYAMQKAVEAYERFNNEYAMKEPIVFSAKTLFQRVRDGGDKPVYELPKGKKRLFANVKPGDGDVSKMIHEYSPQIYGDQHELALQVNLRMVEKCVGLSCGILSQSELRYTNKDEIRASLNQTFSYITKFRRSIEKGLRDCMEAIDALLNVNGVVTMGDWEIQFDWSYDYIESTVQTFNQMMMAEGIGAFADWEIRQFITREDEQTARAAVEQIAEETGADLMREVDNTQTGVV